MAPPTPPAYLAVIPDGIPAELRGLARWVCWQPEWRVNAAGVGKWTKVPLRPDGRAASSTDPATWATFAAALAAYRAGRFAGIGWVLQLPYAGVDFDHVLGDGALDPDTAGWVQSFSGYTERSVSGTGLHIIVKADLPPFGKRRGPREAYSAGRYFTISGHSWPGAPATVEQRDGVLRRFLATLGTDQPQRAPLAALRPVAPAGRYAELGTRTRAHLNSTGANGYPSPSEADAAAAAALIATGHTTEEALALLLDSSRGLDALARKGRHGEAYLARTVQHASAFIGPVVERGGVRVQYASRPWRPRVQESA